MIRIILALIVLCCLNACEKKSTLAQSITVVPIASVVEKNNLLSINTFATVQAKQMIVISAEVSGFVRKIFFQDGEYVNQGQILFQLNDEVESSQLAEAQANLQLQQSLYRKNKALYQKQYASRQALEDVSAALKKAQARVNEISAQLNKKQIVAPFSGILNDRQVNVGGYVAAGNPLVTLINKENLEVNYWLPAELVQVVHIGQKVQIKIPDFPNSRYQGTVNYIDTQLDPGSTRISLRAVITTSANDLLKPGMFVEIVQMLGSPFKSLWAPEQAILMNSKGQFVYKIVNQHVYITPVKTNIPKKGWVEVIEGLHKGDQVVVSQQAQLTDHQSVKTILYQTQNYDENN